MDCQNPEFKILEGQNPEFKILEGQNPEVRILAVQNPEFKILAVQNPEFKILEGQNPEFKMDAASDLVSDQGNIPAILCFYSLLLWYIFVYNLETSIDTKIVSFPNFAFFYKIDEISCILYVGLLFLCDRL